MYICDNLFLMMKNIVVGCVGLCVCVNICLNMLHAMTITTTATTNTERMTIIPENGKQQYVTQYSFTRSFHTLCNI